MTPQQDAQGRQFQIGKLKARLEQSGVLAKISPKGPVTLALYLGDEAKARLALRWTRQSREPYHLLEFLAIDSQDTARPLVRFVSNDLDGLAAELLKAVTGLLSRAPADADEAA